MSRLIQELSVFFPAYNEETNIKSTVEKARKVLLKIAKNWEIFIINDGSVDKTGEIADKLAKYDKRIKVVHHKKNRGYGASLKTGLYLCKYKWIAFTDSDGQFNFSEIINFIETQGKTNADLVIGYYLDRKVSLYRKFNTFIWKMIVLFAFGLSVRDVDTGFKFLSKRVIDKIDRLQAERGAFIESELLIKAKKAGFKIEEIGVKHYPRITGRGTGSDLNVIYDSFVDLFKLYRDLRTS